MEKLFVTGFLPFGDNASNPSELAASFLHMQGYEGEILKVGYQEAEETFKRVKGKDYRYLLFGLAAKRNEISLERFAYNETRKELLDVDGKEPPSPNVMEIEPSVLSTTLDIEGLRSQLDALGLPNHISLDPGRYLCNYSYFLALSESKGEALFVHLPPLDENFDEGKLKVAAKTIADYLSSI